MKTFMKILVLSLLIFSFSHGAEYDKSLLKAHAKLIPKIMLLDQSLKDKLIDGKVKILIAAESKDEQSAQMIAQYIRDIYKSKLLKYPLEIVFQDAQKLDMNVPASAVYLLSLPKNEMKKVLDYIDKKGVISFVYNLDGLNQGALISIRLETKTTIYFNRSSWNSGTIKFRPGFFKIVKSYE